MNIAILIPCYNEEQTIEKVISDFQLAMPYASIYVYDNNSTDNTADIATQAKAIVQHEKNKAKVMSSAECLLIFKLIIIS